MYGKLFITALVIAGLTFPVYKWAEKQYNDRSGITSFETECLNKGGKIVSFGLKACIEKRENN